MTLSFATLVTLLKDQDRSMGPRTVPPRSLTVPMFDVSVFHLLLVCVFILVLVGKWRKSTLPYPPGPKGYPILGNVLDLPASVPIWESLMSLANRQGTLRSCSVSQRF